MFKIQYFRNYPVLLQFLLLVLMMYTMAMFAFAIAYLVVPLIFHVGIKEATENLLSKDRNIRSATLFIQFISSAGTFLFSGLLFAYFTHPRPVEYLGLRKPKKSNHWLIIILLMLGATPVMMGIEGLVKLIPFGASVQNTQKEGELSMGILLDARSFAEFAWVFVVLGILPAAGEEIICRGILMRLINKRTRKPATAIAVSSFIFAVLHFYNPYGLLSIFLAAVLLGYIYYLTGSLWMSMLAHLINNGLQIALIYMGNSSSALKTFIEQDRLPVWIPVAGAVLMGFSLYLLWKNRTPLPDNWSDDFSQEELMQREN